MRPFRETGEDKDVPEVVPRIFDEDEKENGDSDCGENDDNDKRSHDQPLT